MVNSSEIIALNNISQEEKRISSKLFRIRLYSGFSRFELSKITAIDELSIASYENALRPIPASDLYVLSMALGFNVDEVYTMEYSPDKENYNYISAVN